MSDVLADFSVQANIQLIYTDHALARLRTKPVKGLLQPDVALKKILSGSGYSFEFVNKNTIRIFLKNAMPKPLKRAPIAKLKPTRKIFTGREIVTPAFPIEEIVVTASKRPVGLSDQAGSVSVVSGADPILHNATGIADYYRSIAGLTIMDNGPHRKRYVIRGVQTDTINGAPTVAVYLDDVPGIDNVDPALVDIDRIEVLRGPQGTLYGAGAMSGAIRIITRKPELDEWKGSAAVSATTTAHGEAGYSSNIMLNIPIVSGQSALRFVGYHRHDGGFIDHHFPGATIPAFDADTLILSNGESVPLPETPAREILPIDEPNANAKNLIGGRFAFRWEPSESTTLSANAFYEHSRVGDGQNDQPSIGQLTNILAIRQPEDRKTFVINSTLQHEWDRLGIYTTTSYARSKFFRNQDGTRIFGNQPELQRFQGPGMEIWSRDTDSNLTHETRLYSRGLQRFDFVGGIFVSYRKLGLPIQSVRRQQDIEEAILNISVNNISVLETSIFGEISYKLTDTFTATGGMRVANLVSKADPLVFLTNSPYLLFPRADDRISRWQYEETIPVFKFGLSYKPAPGQLFYALASQGFRPGGGNQESPGNMLPRSFASDQLWNYEIGTKANWFEDRLTANVTAYLVDWSNIQVVDYLAGFGFQTNAGAAHVIGLETELSARPARWFKLNAVATLVDARLDSDQPISDDIRFVTGNEGRKGDRLPGVPQKTLKLGAVMDFPISNEAHLTLGLDVAFISDSYVRFNNSSPQQARLPAYTLFNFRSNLLLPHGLSAAFFIDNIFDLRTSLNVYELEWTERLHTPNRPRRIGLQLGIDF